MDRLVKWVEFAPLGDDRGSLVALEANETIPFDIKRVYYLFGTRQDVSRGLHAHLALKQIFLCVTGSCKMLLDDGVSRETVVLDSPTKGLLVKGLVWHEMSEFSSDCVFLAVANEHYDEADYVRDYQVFKELSVKSMKKHK